MKKFFLILILLMWCSPLFAKDHSKKSKLLPPKAVGSAVLKPLWSVALKSKTSKGYLEMSSPVLQGDDLYVGTQAGIFYKVNAPTGKIQWQFSSEGPIASRAVVNSSQVFFGDTKGRVYALTADSGNKKWDVFVGGEILAQPALNGSSVIVVTTSREVYSLSAETGEVQWVTYVKGFEKNITMRGNADVVVSGDKIYLAFADGQIATLNVGNGSILWNKNFGSGDVDFWDIDSSLAVEAGHIYTVGYFGALISLSSGNGGVLWKTDVKSGANLLIDSGSIYLTSADGFLISYNKNSGQQAYKKPFYSGALSSPVSVKEAIIFGSEKSGVFVCDKKGSVLQILKGRGQTFLSAGVSDNQRFYFLSTDGRLLAYSII